jgi:hypothetical protein
MPGNYELYDPSANKLGPVICKECWEGSKMQNPGSLNTVWVSFEGQNAVWWLCHDHTERLRSGGAAPAKFLRSAQGVVLSPRI